MKKNILPLFFAISAICPSVVFGQDHEKLIKDYISQNKMREYKKSDLTHFIIDNIDSSKSLEGDVVKFQQTYNGLPVYNSVGTALVRDNKIMYYSDTFLKDYNSAVPNHISINKTLALQKISQNLQKQEIENYSILGFYDTKPENQTVAKQRLVYVEDGGPLKPAHEFTLPEPNSSSYWDILVDATNGNIIKKLDLTLSCNFQKDAFSYGEASLQNNSFIGPVKETKQDFSLLVPDNASYNVFSLPVESPTFGSRSIVNNPWILTASPEGWHSDGTNHYTITRGNNVYAYEDKTGGNFIGSSPNGGASRDFNFPFNISASPADNLNAATTNLFYMNNKMHDIFYSFGFTSAARNFQQTNFGLGGLGNDNVIAESQDGSDTDNADFTAPPDGTEPRMQVYLWSVANRFLFYNAPGAAVSRQPDARPAQFGNQLNGIGVTGNVKLSPVLDGCSTLPSASLTGKIGLVERGNCSFVDQVKNLQDAGAVAAIVYNDTANGSLIIGLPGFDPDITISTIVITNAEGEYIKSQLAAGIPVNVTLKSDPATAITPDGSFDNVVITHEYGHGISNRLTGDGYSCLDPSESYEQMGEGWSDFFALMLTNRPGDNASVPRGMGTYVLGQPITGNGIRPAKYSPDFAINNYTYGSTNGMEYPIPITGEPDVHKIGFVWAIMLWDLHWQYVAKYGYSSDVMGNTTNGSTRVLQLVTDALKLQACNPTFVDGRNAILAADQAKTGGADKCMIWRAFAKRGLGVNASSGSKTSINDQVEDFTVPTECMLATDEVKVVTNNISIYPNPAKNEFFINFPSSMVGKASVEIYDMSGKLVSSEEKISPDAKKAISTDKLINGTYIVKVKGLGFEAVSKVIVKK